MKKIYIAGFLCMLLFTSIPLAVSQASTEVMIQSDIAEPQSLIGITFIAGLLLNPKEVGNYVQGKAIVLAYYDRGLIIKDSGVLMGLKEVRFKPSNLMYMSEPGQIGVVQVAGICTGFSHSKI
jgi:hypothetical protein